MSRVGRKPIALPPGVEAAAKGRTITVKGKLGELAHEVAECIDFEIADGKITFSRKSNEPAVRARHGLTRALVSNIVVGVSEGFTKKLEVRGTGYRVNVAGSKLTLNIGFSHPVEFDFPPEVKVAMEGTTTKEQLPTSVITISGIDRERVGHWADQVRRVYPPEPYKGKGIRYEGERVIRKAGKTG